MFYLSPMVTTKKTPLIDVQNEIKKESKHFTTK